ncbi:hypothetical protein ABBQ32_002240 [Trebouxia sp. C0010 RCD-2024]
MLSKGCGRLELSITHLITSPMTDEASVYQAGWIERLWTALRSHQQLCLQPCPSSMMQPSIVIEEMSNPLPSRWKGCTKSPKTLQVLDVVYRYPPSLTVCSHR